MHLINPKGWDQVNDERAMCFSKQHSIATREDDDYPRFLNKLTDPPLAIWYQGEIAKRDELL